jgi:Dolichyl-phosphate-mannose-protein mannosyltransferase
MSWSTESCSGTEPAGRSGASRPPRVGAAEIWADRLSLACFALLGVVMIATLPDYGLTYDEQPHIKLGERVLAFYSGGFVRSGSLVRSVYGAGFDLCAALLRRLSPWDEYRTNHILCVFVAQLGLLGTWKLGRWLSGPLGALAALLFLVLTPVYYGHQFNNPKDIPFAVGYIWGLYATAQLLSWTPTPGEPLRRHWRRALGYALILGLAMSVRIAGAVLIGYLVGFLLLRGLDAVRLRRREPLPGALGSLRSVALGRDARVLAGSARQSALKARGRAGDDQQFYCV